MIFEILGEPRGKGRPRFVRATGRTYTDDKTESYECLVRNAFREAKGKYTVHPLKATITAVYGLNKSDYTPKGRLTQKGMAKISGTLKPTKKPDCDNIAKIILDALNWLAYKDDSQVYELTVKKKYGEMAKVIVELE